MNPGHEPGVQSQADTQSILVFGAADHMPPAR